MSEFESHSANALPPTTAGRGTTASSTRLVLEIRMFWIGLGIVLSTAVIVLLAVVLDGDAAVGWAVIGALGVAVAFGAVANAFTADDEVGMQWWHWLLAVFGINVLLRVSARVTDVGELRLLAGIVSVVGLLALVVGAISAAVQLSKESAAVSVGPLVAPLVGYTAEGQPVYGVPARSQSTNAFAIVALTFGVLGGVLGVVFGYFALSQITRWQFTDAFAVLALIFGMFGGVLGIVFGHIALSQIIRTGEGGRGSAIAGLVLGYLSMVGVIAFVVLAALAAAP